MRHCRGGRSTRYARISLTTWTLRPARRPTSSGIFNTRAFAHPTPYTFGNAPCTPPNVNAQALAPLGYPLRIHQPELVAGQKLVREVVCRIAGEKDVGVGEVSVERLCHAASNRRLFSRVESRQDAQQIIVEFTPDEMVVNEAVVLLAGIGRIWTDTGAQNL